MPAKLSEQYVEKVYDQLADELVAIGITDKNLICKVVCWHLERVTKAFRERDKPYN